MRPATPACWLLISLGLLPVAADGAGRKQTPDDAPPVLISKDGGTTEWADSPPVWISRDGGKPKWTNVEQLRMFAAKGDVQACFELAELVLHGREVPQDTPQAVRLLEQAAQGGIPDAWFRLGKIYHDGLTGARDYGRALDYYTRAARAGVPEAQHNIGAMLVSARGVKRNLIEGLAWLIVATKSGAVSEAEVQVRHGLAKRPADIKSAETRAGELLGNLSAATVRAELKVPPTPSSGAMSKVPPAPAISHQMEKPVIAPVAIDPPVPPKIAPPVSPPALPLPEKP